MSELRDWLEIKQGDLVSSLEAAIARAERAMPLSHLQLSAFVLALAAATDQDQRVIEQLLRQWHEESLPGDSPGLWVVTLVAMREAIWAHTVSEFSPARALHHLKALDYVLSRATIVAVELDISYQLYEQERSLQKIRHQLRRLEHSKSDFIKIAAHELKTPLTLIDGYANMLMSQIPEESRPKTDILLGGIANGTRRLGEIIEGMIDVSMIDTQVLGISFQPLFIRQVVKTVAEELAPVLRIRQIELIIDSFPEDGAPTYGDSERLYQAVYNVVGNAIKFTPDGGRIHIRNSVSNGDAAKLEEVRGYLDLQISDSGIGIAPENLEHVFGKFVGLGSVALHSTGKYKFKGGGPGLGLAISRGIIEAHGGKIWAESDGYDESQYPGSTFHIVVPLYDRPPVSLAGSTSSGKQLDSSAG